MKGQARSPAPGRTSQGDPSPRKEGSASGKQNGGGAATEVQRGRESSSEESEGQADKTSCYRVPKEVPVAPVPPRATQSNWPPRKPNSEQNSNNRKLSEMPNIDGFVTSGNSVPSHSLLSRLCGVG